MVGFAGAALVGAGGGGCSVPTGEVPRPGTCEPFQLTSTLPSPGATDVPPDVTMAATFNDFPDPDSVDIASLTLYTGSFYHTGRYWVDLVDRRALFRPSGPLTLGLGYTMGIRPAVRSLRGCSLKPPPLTPEGLQPDAYYIMFQIVEPGVDRPAQPVSTPTTFANVVTLFAGHCAGEGCHVGSADTMTGEATCLATPGAGLSLCGRDAYDQLVGIRSAEVNHLVRVAPQDSARSYLLRKLVGAPPLIGHAGPPGDTLSRADVLAIEAWIDSGALGATTSGQ